MARKLPPGLTDHQREALTQFFAGHLSAGQLTERLGVAGAQSAAAVAVADLPVGPAPTASFDPPLFSHPDPGRARRHSRRWWRRGPSHAASAAEASAV